MRRYFVVFMILASVILNWLPVFSADDDQLAASLEVLVPGVEVKANGTEEWLAVTGRSVVGTGDMIRTDETGEALITWFSDGTLLALETETEVTIDEFSGDEDAFAIQTTVSVGRVFNAVNRLVNDRSRYEVNTSDMTAAVRGTVFAIDANPETGTLLVVNDGTVYTEIEDEHVDIEAGFFLQLPPKVNILDLPSGGGGEPDSSNDNGDEEVAAEAIPSYALDSIESNMDLANYATEFEDFDEGRQDPDGDLIFNFTDACPDVFGFVKFNGCPDQVSMPDEQTLGDGTPRTQIPPTRTRPRPTATHTLVPTDTPLPRPTDTSLPPPTNTRMPATRTSTPFPTKTTIPLTEIPRATDTPLPTNTAVPPTLTDIPTKTLLPTDTPLPIPTDTATPDGTGG